MWDLWVSFLNMNIGGKNLSKMAAIEIQSHDLTQHRQLGHTISGWLRHEFKLHSLLFWPSFRRSSLLVYLPSYFGQETAKKKKKKSKSITEKTVSCN